MQTLTKPMKTFDFHLPATLSAGEPPEARGLARDQVRLMVSHHQTDRVTHTQFRDLPCYLEAGDVVVINTSGTMNSALPAVRADGSILELHLSTRLPADLWSVELREISSNATQPFRQNVAGETLELPSGATITLHTPYASHQRCPDCTVRLWVATLNLPQPLGDYLQRYGMPIRYSYVNESWPLEYYQTVYVTEMGSAEMPSAGRAFTPEILTRLVAKGVQVAPLILHTGVASLEEHEPPYEEFYRVSEQTAQVINLARQNGKRIIAVGTTAIRALETVADTQGNVHPSEGWTKLVITPDRPMRVIDGLITGMHEPKATHLAMLMALAGKPHIQHTYQQALERGYLWHEFGDLHLILP